MSTATTYGSWRPCRRKRSSTILEDDIDAVIDTEAFNHEIDQEKADAVKLEGVRHVVQETLKEGSWEE